jgi:hypothetical protein
VKLHPVIQLKGPSLGALGHGAQTESDVSPVPHTVLYVPALHWDVLHWEQLMDEDL